LKGITLSDNTSRSILLQVAFKEAASAILGTAGNLAELTTEYFNTLVSLHEKFGIEIKDREYGKGGGGGGQRSFGGGFSSTGGTSKPLPVGVIEFTDASGTAWVDYRPAKATGDVVAKHPDFKTADHKQSEWLFKQDGTENATAVTLATAADQMADLVAPL
jgi:hypothetical protein